MRKTVVLLAGGLIISSWLSAQNSENASPIKKEITVLSDDYSKSSNNVNVVNSSNSENMPTSGLEAYERLLKNYETEKINAALQNLCTDEIDLKIAQLKEKIAFEKAKAIKGSKDK